VAHTQSNGLTRRVIFAGTIGNAIDFYDFIVYGYLASYFAANFFPQSNPLAAMLASYTAFAVGLIMRPIGGVIFGNIGDRFSRKSALQWSVITMALPTFLVGLLPTYHEVGLLAPISLFALRMIQGLAVGGEYGASMVYMIEKAPRNRRGFIGSFCSFGAATGFFIGAGVGLICTSTLTASEMHDWGWRIPFLLSLILTITGVIVRRKLVDDRINPQQSVKTPVREVIKHHAGQLITVALTNCCVNVTSYVGFVYVVSWLIRQIHVAPSTALSINLLSLLACILMSTAGGLLADRIGKLRTLKLGAWCFALGALPIFYLFETGQFGLMLLAAVLIAVIQGLFQGALASLIVTVFPKNIRVSGVGFSYNLAVGVFGGFSPLIADYLVTDLHISLAPAYLMIAGALVSLCTLYLSPIWRKSDELFPEDHIAA
jgi:MFS transporter, MHS family, proline/betaine transporter